MSRIIMGFLRTVWLFFKALMVRSQLLKMVQFMIMVCTLLLAFLSAIEPIIRFPGNPPVPPPEEPANVSGYLIFDLVDNVHPDQVAYLEERLGAEFYFTDSTTVDEGIGYAYVDDMWAAKHIVSDLLFVESVEAEIWYEATGLWPESGWPHGPPNDPMYELQWNMEMIGAPYAWANSPRGKGVTVAVIDTGVTKVADLAQTNVLPGKSFVPGEDQHDGNGHGTHVAGTIAQSTNNGEGVTGIAPEATILPVKVLSDYGSGRHDWIAAGIYYAVDEGADVINMSLGGPPGKVVEKAVKHAHDKGVIVVCACGNSGTKHCGYPAAYEESVAVSALGPDGNLSFYSDHGKGVTIAAPGGNKNFKNGGITQHTLQNGREVYGEFQGTSMASPHVAGAAAVLLSMGQNPEQTLETLYQTADGDEWSEEYGYGKLNLEAAVQDAGGTTFPVNTRPIAMATILMLLLGWLGGTSRDYTTTSIAAAALSVGGLFFLPMLPLPEHWILAMLASPILEWPNFIHAGWANFPLWMSALPIGAFAYTAGLHQKVRALTAGATIGIGTYLVYGAFTGAITPWFMPVWVAFPWLVVNAAACGFIAMSLTGVQHLEEEHSD